MNKKNHLGYKIRGSAKARRHLEQSQDEGLQTTQNQRSSGKGKKKNAKKNVAATSEKPVVDVAELKAQLASHAETKSAAVKEEAARVLGAKSQAVSAPEEGRRKDRRIAKLAKEHRKKKTFVPNSKWRKGQDVESKKTARNQVLKKQSTGQGTKKKFIRRKEKRQAKRKMAKELNERRLSTRVRDEKVKTRADYRREKWVRDIDDFYDNWMAHTTGRIMTPSWNKVSAMTQRMAYAESGGKHDMHDKIPWSAINEWLDKKVRNSGLPGNMKEAEKRKKLKLILAFFGAKQARENGGEAHSQALQSMVPNLADEVMDRLATYSPKDILKMPRTYGDTPEAVLGEFKSIPYSKAMLQLMLIMAGIEPNPGPFDMDFKFRGVNPDSPSLRELLSEVPNEMVALRIMQDLYYIDPKYTVADLIRFFIIADCTICEQAHNHLYYKMIKYLRRPSDPIAQFVNARVKRNPELIMLTGSQLVEVKRACRDLDESDMLMRWAYSILNNTCFQFETELFKEVVQDWAQGKYAGEDIENLLMQNWDPVTLARRSKPLDYEEAEQKVREAAAAAKPGNCVRQLNIRVCEDSDSEPQCEDRSGRDERPTDDEQSTETDAHAESSPPEDRKLIDAALRRGDEKFLAAHSNNPDTPIEVVVPKERPSLESALAAASRKFLDAHAGDKKSKPIVVTIPESEISDPEREQTLLLCPSRALSRPQSAPIPEEIVECRGRGVSADSAAPCPEGESDSSDDSEPEPPDDDEPPPQPPRVLPLEPQLGDEAMLYPPLFDYRRLDGASIPVEMMFRGRFKGLESTFDPEDPLVIVRQNTTIGTGEIWSHDMPISVVRVRITRRMIDMAARASPANDKSARFRNLVTMLGSSAKLAEDMAEWPASQVLEFATTKFLIAFLLTGCVYSCGTLKALPDVSAMVPVLYECPPVSDKDRARVDRFAEIDNDQIRNLKRDLSCARAAPIFARGFGVHMPSTCSVNNIYACLAKRILPEPIPVSSSTYRALSNIADALVEHIRNVAANHHMPDPDELCEDAIADRPIHVRENFRRGFIRWDTDPDNTVHWMATQVYEAFYKNEHLDFMAMKPVRLIMSLPEEARGVQLRVMCQIMWMIETGTRECNVKHLTPAQIRQRIIEKFGNAGDAYEGDYTSFESCNTPALKDAVENRIFEALATQPQQVIYIRRVLGRRYVTVQGRGFYMRRCPHIRMSGDLWTSLGNLITNIVVTCYIMQRPVDVVVRDCLFEGDDSLMIVYRPIADVEEAAMRAGMRLKISKAPWHQLSFCGNHFEERNGDLVLVRDPMKMIAQVSNLFDPNPASRRDDVLLQRAKVLSMFQMPWVRQASAFCAVIERATNAFTVTREFLVARNLVGEYKPYATERAVPDFLKVSLDAVWAGVVADRDRRAGGSLTASQVMSMLSQARKALESPYPIPIETPFDTPEAETPMQYQEGLRKSFFGHAFGFLPYRVSHDDRLPRLCLPSSSVVARGQVVRAGWGPLGAWIGRNKKELLIAGAALAAIWYMTGRSPVSFATDVVSQAATMTKEVIKHCVLWPARLLKNTASVGWSLIQKCRGVLHTVGTGACDVGKAVVTTVADKAVSVPKSLAPRVASASNTALVASKALASRVANWTSSAGAKAVNAVCSFSRSSAPYVKDAAAKTAHCAAELSKTAFEAAKPYVLQVAETTLDKVKKSPEYARTAYDAVKDLIGRLTPKTRESDIASSLQRVLDQIQHALDAEQEAGA